MNEIKNILPKIKEGKEIQKEIRFKTIGYIVAAFGLVAALAWNDAIKSLIEVFFPIKQNSLWAKFGYAFIITIMVAIVTICLMRFGNKNNKK